jgi:hypothetical protein
MFNDLESSDEDDHNDNKTENDVEAEKGFTVSNPVVDNEGYY